MSLLSWLAKRPTIYHCLSVEKTEASGTHLVAVCGYQRLPKDQSGDRIVQREAYLDIAEEGDIGAPNNCHKCGDIMYDEMVTESLKGFTNAT